MVDSLERLLAEGCLSLQLSVSAEQRAALLDYRAVLAKWNRAFNLTSIRNDTDMVIRHLLDSLAVAPHLVGDEFLDVGTGAGLPGIPLAIVCPDRRFTLIDSNGKKTRFLFQVQTLLGIANIDVVEARVEDWQTSRRFDGILTRAFAPLSTMVFLSQHLLAETGRFFALKSQALDTELDALPDNLQVENNICLSVPRLSETRWLTILKQSMPGDPA